MAAEIGQIFFAWVASGEEWDPGIHARHDEQVFSLSISEIEGEFALATVRVRNPRTGLLSPARKQRCFISAELDGVVTLVFSGRVVGIPVSLAAETCELEFVGRPDNFAETQADLIENLKEAPRYHAALVAEEQRDDPTAVLEGFAGLLHFHRVTGELTLAPIARDGSQTVIDLTPSAIMSSLDVSFGSAPVAAVKVSLDVSWEQLCPVVSHPFTAEPGAAAQGVIAEAFGGRPVTLTGDDFLSRWPAQGAAIDGGWTVLSSYLSPVGDSEDPGFYSRSVPVSVAPPVDTSYSQTSYPIQFRRSKFDGTLVLAGTYRQPRRETIELTVTSDLQPVSDFGNPEEIYLSAVGEDVAPLSKLTLTTSVRAPAEDGDGMTARLLAFSVERSGLAHPALAKRDFFDAVLTAAVARAEARLRVAARCVTSTVDIPAAAAFSITTADVVLVSDDRIPGGEITGKVTEVQIDIEFGKAPVAKVKFAASVGRSATALSALASVDDYDAPSEPAVVSHCRVAGPDDGTLALAGCRVRNPLSAQEAALSGLDLSAEVSRFAALGYKWAQTVDSEAALAAMSEAIAKIPTEIDGQFVSLEPRDETVTPVTCTVSRGVAIMRDIDLEG